MASVGWCSTASGSSGDGVENVALLAAGLVDDVGDVGDVGGTDRVPAAVEAATKRTTALSLRNVSFRTGDPAEMSFERPFDAVIGAATSCSFNTIRRRCFGS